jgi:hypothetical protein
MKKLLQTIRNKSLHFTQGSIYPRLKRAFFPLIVYCVGTFFMQEEDETVMYIVLFAIVLIVGLVNLIRGFFPKNRRHGKKGDPDKDRGPHGHGSH